MLQRHGWRLFGHPLLLSQLDTLREAGARSDPYAMLARMLAHGSPPGDWPGLLAARLAPPAWRRLAGTTG